MDIKNLVGQPVKHKSFGNGIIKNAYGRYLEIDFLQYNKQSKFIYPSCFDGFLSMEDEELQKDAAKELKQWKIDSGAIQKEKLRKKYEKTQQAIKARQVAAEEKKQKTGQKVIELRSNYKRGGRNGRK